VLGFQRRCNNFTSHNITGNNITGNNITGNNITGNNTTGFKFWTPTHKTSNAAGEMAQHNIAQDSQHMHWIPTPASHRWRRPTGEDSRS
jgi:hypothetical protein